MATFDVAPKKLLSVIFDLVFNKFSVSSELLITTVHRTWHSIFVVLFNMFVECRLSREISRAPRPGTLDPRRLVYLSHMSINVVLACSSVYTSFPVAFEWFEFVVDGQNVLVEVGFQRKRPVATLPFALVSSYIEMDGVNVKFDSVWITFEKYLTTFPMTLENLREIKVDGVNMELKLVWLTNYNLTTSWVWTGIPCASSCRSLTVAKCPIFIVYLNLILRRTSDVQR